MITHRLTDCGQAWRRHWSGFLFFSTEPFTVDPLSVCICFEKKKCKCYNKNGINVNISSALDCLKPQAWKGNTINALLK